MFQISSFDQQRILLASVDPRNRFSAGVLEKDLAITAVLSIVAGLEFEYPVIFGGGTSLVKARGLMDRLSEDVDLKLVIPEGENRSQKRKKIRQIRTELLSAFVTAGFEVTSSRTYFEGRYTKIQLDYLSWFAENPVSSSITVDLFAQVALAEAEYLPILDLLGATESAESNSLSKAIMGMHVASLSETVPQKVVAFLSRLEQLQRQPKLIRHLYDIWRVDGLEIDMSIAQSVFDYSIAELPSRDKAFSSEYQAWEVLQTRHKALANDPNLRIVFEGQMRVLAATQVQFSEVLEIFENTAKAFLEKSAHRPTN